MALANQTFEPQVALKAARTAAAAGSKVLMECFGRLTQVSEKHLAGLVSEADVASEKAIQKELLQHYPAGFLGEESSQEAAAGWPTTGNHWIVDPLDGTTNYVHRFPIFCISIGLMWEGEFVLGLVHSPLLNQTYHAVKGGGAFCNDKPIHVSSRDVVRDSLLATGFFRDNAAALKQQLEIFSKLVFEARGIRRAGAAAYDLCLVADGVFEAFWEKNLKPWDTAAGIVIVQEAGGVISDYAGRPFHINSDSILAGNKPLHKKILATIKGI